MASLKCTNILPRRPQAIAKGLRWISGAAAATIAGARSTSMALLLLVGIFFALHPAPARADTSPPGDEMLFWCIGGGCEFPPCPEDSFLHPSTVSQLRSCSEANWAAYSQWEFGPLTFAGEKIYPGHAPQVEFDWASPNGPVADTMQAKIDDEDDGVPNRGPGKNLGNQDCGKCSGTAIGNPINLATGNKFGDETDADGVGRFPLAFQRFYNSIGAGNGPLLKAGGRRVEGRCLVDDSCRKVGPVWWEPMSVTGFGAGRYPETPPQGCTCTKWMSEDDIDPGGSGGASSADQWDAMDAATQLMNARRAQRQIQQEYQRELKE